MTHISKRKLGDKDFEKLYIELIHSFERSFKNNRTKNVFEEFLTPTEKVMLVKRFAVIAMLSKEISIHTIAESLNMSPATVDRMSLKYEMGKYTSIVKDALGKKDIWEIIDHILSGGGTIPSKVGKGRWKNFDRSVREEKLMKS